MDLSVLWRQPYLDFPILVLLLPLSGFVVLSLFGDWLKRDGEEWGAGYIASGTVIVSFLLAAFSVRSLFGLGIKPEHLRFAQPVVGWPPFDPERIPLPWISVGGLEIPFSLLLDPLSALLMLVVTGVGSLIHVYSIGYMAHDEERVRYFSYLNLFTFFMLLLVLGGSLPLMFVGWEGVGLCSYFLIGFWFKKKSAADAGKKAFIVNRVGDAGLILGMILTFHAFGSLDLVEIADHAGKLSPEALGQVGVITAVCLLLFVGACGKSAQVPLHVWLPDAMEGPTPVSALIHAATMVTAGVYMVARLAPLYHASPTASTVVAIVGATTALLAATIALVQTDIKKVLAYSTVSQLGYMFLALGVGAYGAAVFHLFTHAFFKALLFLGSGSVIHAMSGEQDMRQMGGLWKKIPITFGTFAVGTAAIAGVPFLSGFYSKEEILHATLNGTAVGPWLLAVGLFTAGLTAFYMTRMFVLTFLGRFRGDHETEHHVHESPLSMTVPLCLLAVGSIVAGYHWLLDVPGFLRPVFRLPEAHPHEARWLMAVALAVAGAGIVGAAFLYTLYSDVPPRIMASFRRLHGALTAKYGFDTAFDWLASRVVVGGSEHVLWKRVDAQGIDGAVNGTASVVDAIARRVRLLQSGLVRGYALLILAGTVALLGYLTWAR
jgi:NADH-quinone oxidoreductase subunit L